MSTFSPAASNPARYVAAGAWSLGVIALTGIHHAYGAVIYDTPWRLHILEVALPIGAAITAILFVAYRRADTAIGRIALWLAVATILVFPVLLIGVYEGGFNHLVKGIAYLGWGTDGVAALNAAGDNPLVQAIVGVALGHEANEAIFEHGLFEPPGDLFFELSGIAQVPVALVAGWAAVRLWRTAR
jgi:hypothetical protein